MREIKFRAWDTYNERMVYDPEKFIPTGPHHYTDDPRFNSPFQYYETWQDIEDGIHRPCYIMQFTGLKDKNGKEIYEGDVLKYEYKRDAKTWDTFTEVVEWEETGDHFGFCIHAEMAHYEIIGNIHEHPHLLNPISQ